MGTTLDDLRDYMDIETGNKAQEGPNANEGIQRYAYVVGPKKEAELNEFRGKSYIPIWSNCPFTMESYEIISTVCDGAKAEKECHASGAHTLDS